MATPNMNLDLPTVSITLGPTWASELNAALELVDSHDHTSGKGIPIRTAALDIDADLSLQNFRLVDSTSLQLVTAASPVSGVGFENSLSAASGDLYWTNSSGVAVQITDGNSLYAPPVPITTLEYLDVAGDLILGSGNPAMVLAVDCSAPRSITLPLANSVPAGRFYIVKDATNQSETNTLTLDANGSDTIDGASSVAITSDGASVVVVGDGVSAWSIW